MLPLPSFHDWHSFIVSDALWASSDSPAALGFCFWKVEDSLAAHECCLCHLRHDDWVSTGKWEGWVNWNQCFPLPTALQGRSEGLSDAGQLVKQQCHNSWLERIH